MCVSLFLVSGLLCRQLLDGSLLFACFLWTQCALSVPHPSCFRLRQSHKLLRLCVSLPCILADGWLHHGPWGLLFFSHLLAGSQIHSLTFPPALLTTTENGIFLLPDNQLLSKCGQRESVAEAQWEGAGGRIGQAISSFLSLSSAQALGVALSPLWLPLPLPLHWPLPQWSHLATGSSSRWRPW